LAPCVAAPAAVVPAAEVALLLLLLSSLPQAAATSTAAPSASDNSILPDTDFIRYVLSSALGGQIPAGALTQGTSARYGAETTDSVYAQCPPPTGRAGGRRT